VSEESVLSVVVEEGASGDAALPLHSTIWCPQSYLLSNRHHSLEQASCLLRLRLPRRGAPRSTPPNEHLERLAGLTLFMQSISSISLTQV
jgi:hypothetical protein